MELEGFEGLEGLEGLEVPGVWSGVGEKLGYLLAVGAVGGEGEEKRNVEWRGMEGGGEEIPPWGTIRMKSGGKPVIGGKGGKGGKKASVSSVAPEVFAALREEWGIPVEAFVASLTDVGLEGGSTGAGKSGMLFFRTGDRRYVVKTMPSSEVSFLRKILPSYAAYMVSDEGRHSCLPRFVACAKVKIGGDTLRLVVMNNVFHTPLSLSAVYDLKGSTRARLVTRKEVVGEGVSVFKDLNLTQRIHVGQTADTLIEQLESDSLWLRSVRVMDYSLLLGIHAPDLGFDCDVDSFSLSDDDDLAAHPCSNDGGETADNGPAAHHAPPSVGGWVPEPPPLPLPPPFQSRFQSYLGGMRSTDPEDWRELDARHVYFVGIIDVLQRYNVKKRVEHALKAQANKRQVRKTESAVLASDLALTPAQSAETAMSAVDPQTYQSRFMDFMRVIITSEPPSREDIAAQALDVGALPHEQASFRRRHKALDRQLRKVTPRTFANSATPGPAQYPTSAL